MPGPSYHGRTHARGGTDPIPGLVIGTQFPNVREYKAHGLELLYLVENGLWDDGSTWDFVTVESSVPGSTATAASADAPFGGYLELVGQNSYVCLGFPLAPQYSVWKFDPILGIGPDCGIVDVEWQTVSARFASGSEGFNGAFSPSVFEQWGQIPANLTSDTGWYRSGTPIGRYQVDCYSGSAGLVNTDGDAAPNLYLTGEPGDLLAANPTGAAYTDTHEWPAGADGETWWWVRLKTKTKHASSSGYTLRLHGYSMHRVVGDLITPG